MRPTPPTEAFQHGEGSNSGARPAELQSRSPRRANRWVGWVRTAQGANWKRLSRHQRSSRSSPPLEAERKHSEPGTAKHQALMQVPGLTECAVQRASCHRQSRCDRRHRPAGKEVSWRSGRRRGWGEIRRLLSSFRRIIVAMPKSRQVDIASDHSQGHSGGEQFLAASSTCRANRCSPAARVGGNGGDQ